jgi:uncharacterized protein (TIGR04222 family)
MRRIIVLSFLLALALSLAGGALFAAKDYRAERFDATWEVSADGSLLVTETIAFRFDGGPFTYVYRELPLDYSDGIEIIAARLDGQPLPRGEGANAYEVDDKDPLEVTWRFEPTSDATRTFELTYRVAGVVRHEGGEDLLWWNFLPTDYEYPIDAATLRVSYHASAERIGPAEVRRGQANVTERDGEARFEATNIPAGEPLTVALRFAEGSLISAPPAWQTREARVAERAPYVGGAAALATLLGGGWLFAIWRGGRRESTFAPPRESMVYSPPSNLAPALAGALTSGNGKATAAHALATIFSLAQRGLISIEQTGAKKWYADPPYAFHKTPALAAAQLSEHERSLVDLLFADKNGAKDEVTLSEAGRRLQSKLSPFAKTVEAELTQQGYVDPARRNYTNRFYVACVVLLALALVAATAGAFLVRELGGWIFLLPVGLFTLSMVALALGASYPPFTERGEDAAARWRGFQQHIKTVAKGREPSWDTRAFDRYFPYAAAFGLAEGWAKAYEKAGATEIPAWFRSASAGGDVNVGAFVAMTAAINSTSASGGGGGAGGGGAGGGGGSGAG